MAILLNDRDKALQAAAYRSKTAAVTISGTASAFLLPRNTTTITPAAIILTATPSGSIYTSAAIYTWSYALSNAPSTWIQLSTGANLTTQTLNNSDSWVKNASVQYRCVVTEPLIDTTYSYYTVTYTAEASDAVIVNYTRSNVLVTCDSSGIPLSYVNTDQVITVNRGATLLAYSTNTTTPSSFTVTYTATNLTVAAGTGTGTTWTQPAITAIAQDGATITYTITVYDINLAATIYTKTIVYNKVSNGVIGADGVNLYPTLNYDFAGAALPVGFTFTGTSDTSDYDTTTTISTGQPLRAVGLSLIPANSYIISMRIKVVAGTWNGKLYYTNTTQTESVNYYKTIPAPAPGVWTTINLDMRSLTVGSTNFMAGGTVTGLRFDLGADANSIISIDYISVGKYGIAEASKTAPVSMYVWAPAGTTLTYTGVFTYTWSGGTVSAYPTAYTRTTDTVSPVIMSWTSTAGIAPGNGYVLYQRNLNIKDVAYATTTTANWSSSTQNTIGYRNDGTIGYQGDSYRIAYIVTIGQWTNPVAPTAGTGDVAPTSTVVVGTTTSNWSYTATSTLNSGEYMYQTDGILNKITNVITWGTPYLSNLKVGSLSALAADLGSVQISTSGGLYSAGKTSFSSTFAGFYLGNDSGTYKFKVGSNTNYLSWDGTTLAARSLSLRDSTGAEYLFAGPNASFKDRLPNTTNMPAENATVGATWGTDIINIPYDKIYSTDAATSLGFNPSFEAWSGTAPDYWTVMGNSPTKETVITRFGSNAVKYVANGEVSLGIKRLASWTSSPLLAGTFMSGTVDIYLAAITSGLPGVVVSLYTDAALTTSYSTLIQPEIILGQWQKIPFSVRVRSSADLIYAIEITILGSSNVFTTGVFKGTVLFDGISFGLFDSSIDNRQIAISSNGSLVNAGGGQVTLPGMGHNTYRVVSKGLSATTLASTAGLYFNNTLVYTGTRSYQLTRISRDTGQITFNQSYDIFSSTTAATALATALNASTSTSIVIVTTYDEPQTNRLLNGLDTAMYRCGASRAVYGSANFKFRSAYILIGIGGCGEGNGAEGYQGAIDSDTNAWCDLSFSIINGQLTGVSGTYTPTTLKDYGYIGDTDATNGAPSGTRVNGVLAQDITTNITTVTNTLADIASDNILTPVEKSTVILDYNTIIGQQSVLDGQAATFGITTEKTDYDSAVTALTTYLATLTAPVLWSNTGGNTTIVGSTFRTKFQAVYTAQQTLSSAIAAKAKKAGDDAASAASAAATAAADAQTLSLASSGYMTVSGNTFTKTLSNSTWDSQVYSKNSYVGGAYVKFNAVQSNVHIMVGLNSDPTTDASYGSIDYAIYLTGDTSLLIYESGSGISTGLTYAVGDVFSITYDGSNINYYKNSTVLRTVAASIPNPLFLDSSFYNAGSVSKVEFGPMSSNAWSAITGQPAGIYNSNINITNGALNGIGSGAGTSVANSLVETLGLTSSGGMTVTGNTFTRTSGAGVDWDAQVYSNDSYIGGAYVRFAPLSMNKALMVGLNSDPTSNASYNTIDYAIYLTGTTIQVYENGTYVSVGEGNYSLSDIFSVTYDGSNVKYYKNGTVLRTIAARITGALYLDSSFVQIGSGVTKVSFGPMSSNYWGDIGGSTKPEDNATKGANWSTNVTGAAAVDLAIKNAGDSATSAINTLADIANDNILTPVEKTIVILNYNTIIAEQSGIDTQATNASITTQKTAYDSAVTALATYLGTLKTPVGWNDISGNTAIVGDTFRLNFQNVYTTKQALLNAISTKIKTTADNATTNLGNKLDLASTTQSLSGSINLSSQFAIKQGTPALDGVAGHNGVFYGSTGLYGTKDGKATFSISNTGDAAFKGNLTGATGTFSGSLQVGSNPAISGTTMSGSGAIVNDTGTFALGSDKTNITFNNGAMRLNGNVVDIENLIPGAALPNYVRTYKGSASAAINVGTLSSNTAWGPLAMDANALNNKLGAIDYDAYRTLFPAGTYFYELSVPVKNNTSDTNDATYTAIVENPPGGPTNGSYQNQFVGYDSDGFAVYQNSLVPVYNVISTAGVNVAGDWQTATIFGVGRFTLSSPTYLSAAVMSTENNSMYVVAKPGYCTLIWRVWRAN